MTTKDDSTVDRQSLNSDEAQLEALGYKQVLHRTWRQFESFMAAFGSLYFVGGVRILFSYGIYAGGPAALWSSFLITVPLMTIVAAILAEICSALPLSGSIYIWAAEAAGPRWGRLAGFIVAFWATTAWTSFVASNTQATANFLLTELVVFESDFPALGDDTDIRWRALVWGVSVAFLLLAIISNYLPPRAYTWVFRASMGIIVIDFLLTFIWLPIGVSQTYGFQSAEWVFTERNNGTGAPEGWNWLLCFLFTSGVLTGFDAAGHIAEETQGASLRAARGLFWSCVATGVLAFPTLLLFLFCSPSLDVLFDLAAPQPFVLIYQAALGQGGQVFMTIVCIVGLFINTSIAIVAASRLVFAIARDGILPGHRWIGKVDKDGQPRNAVTFIGIVAFVLVCMILPSPVAFTSLVSCGAVPTIASYGAIALLRLIFTPNEFKNGRWNCGRWTKVFCWIAVPWNAFLVAVLLSPVSFPVTADTFNFAPAVFAGVTIIAIISYWATPEDVWLSGRNVNHMLKATEIPAASNFHSAQFGSPMLNGEKKNQDVAPSADEIHK